MLNKFFFCQVNVKNVQLNKIISLFTSNVFLHTNICKLSTCTYGFIRMEYCFFCNDVHIFIAMP